MRYDGPALQIDAPRSVTLWLYIRRELLFIAHALVDVALITPFFLLVTPWTRFWSPAAVALTLLFLILLPLNLMRSMAMWGFSIRRQQLAITSLLGVAVLVALRLVLFAGRPIFDVGWLRDLWQHIAVQGNPFLTRDVSLAFLVIIAWWRGLALLGRETDMTRIGLRVRVGALIVLPLVVTLTGLRLEHSMTPFVLLFFLGCLLLIALSRAEEIELQRSGRAYPMSPRWLGMILAATLIIIFTGGLLAAVIAGGDVNAALGLFGPVWRAITFGALTTMATLAYFALPIINLLDWITRTILAFNLRTFQPLTPDEGNSGGVEPVDNVLELLLDAAQGRDIEWGLAATLITVILIVLTGLFLTNFFRQQALRVRPAIDAETGLGDINRTDQPVASLGDRLQARWDQLRRWRAAASIRRIYAQMNRAAATHGYGRSPTETPFEHLPTLHRAWPDHHDEVAQITNAFVNVRYGELPETAAELDAIKVAWERVERTRPVEATAPEIKSS